ncbi:EF-hand domain-containing protein [Stieleria sp. TO1_6]|uniref:EF-hand domain-containing protein n=1 Tax=Stieleria tagensis TaxID=2956795 RepID=UPI00209B07A0|nr:EF-hand domain-containing protein [Stieleria tagensis]MCO8124723.1 EF-hand domain-containing protein [Stieleria tagensis]
MQRQTTRLTGFLGSGLLGITLIIGALTADAQDTDSPDSNGRAQIDNVQSGDVRPAEQRSPRRDGQTGNRRFGRPTDQGNRPPGAGAEMLRRMPVIAALDSDGDGELSTAEIDQAATALRKLDRNGDGRLDLREMMPRFPDRDQDGRMQMNRRPGGDDSGDAASRMDRLMRQDKNGDGFLSADELPPALARLLQRADRDADGQLSRQEIQAAMSSRSAGSQPKGDRRGADRSDETPGGEKPRRPPAE